MFRNDQAVVIEQFRLEFLVFLLWQVLQRVSG